MDTSALYVLERIKCCWRRDPCRLDYYHFTVLLLISFLLGLVNVRPKFLCFVNKFFKIQFVYLEKELRSPWQNKWEQKKNIFIFMIMINETHLLCTVLYITVAQTICVSSNVQTLVGKKNEKHKVTFPQWFLLHHSIWCVPWQEKKSSKCPRIN